MISLVESIPIALSCLPFLRSLDQYYPGIEDWYVNTVATGLIDSETKVLVARDRGLITGMAIGKKGEETKLRCVRVLPEYANTGLGIKLMDRMFEQLECSKPHATVSEELLHSYSRIFVNRYGFKLDEVKKGLYFV